MICGVLSFRGIMELLKDFLLKNELIDYSFFLSSNPGLIGPNYFEVNNLLNYMS